jgi:hypothetical protein
MTIWVPLLMVGGLAYGLSQYEKSSRAEAREDAERESRRRAEEYLEEEQRRQAEERFRQQFRRQEANRVRREMQAYLASPKWQDHLAIIDLARTANYETLIQRVRELSSLDDFFSARNFDIIRELIPQHCNLSPFDIDYIERRRNFAGEPLCHEFNGARDFLLPCNNEGVHLFGAILNNPNLTSEKKRDLLIELANNKGYARASQILFRFEETLSIILQDAVLLQAAYHSIVTIYGNAERGLPPNVRRTLAACVDKLIDGPQNVRNFLLARHEYALAVTLDKRWMNSLNSTADVAKSYDEIVKVYSQHPEMKSHADPNLGKIAKQRMLYLELHASEKKDTGEDKKADSFLNAHRGLHWYHSQTQSKNMYDFIHSHNPLAKSAIAKIKILKSLSSSKEVMQTFTEIKTNLDQLGSNVASKVLNETFKAAKLRILILELNKKEDKHEQAKRSSSEEQKDNTEISLFLNQHRGWHWYGSQTSSKDAYDLIRAKNRLQAYGEIDKQYDVFQKESYLYSNFSI